MNHISTIPPPSCLLPSIAFTRRLTPFGSPHLSPFFQPFANLRFKAAVGRFVVAAIFGQVLLVGDGVVEVVAVLGAFAVPERFRAAGAGIAEGLGYPQRAAFAGALSVVARGDRSRGGFHGSGQ